jgi:hypothetical protein
MRHLDVAGEEPKSVVLLPCPTRPLKCQIFLFAPRMGHEVIPPRMSWYSRASACDPIQWSLSRAPSAGPFQSRGFRQATAARLAPGGNPTTRRYGSFLPGKREPGQPATCIQHLSNTNHLNGVPKRRPRLVFLPPASESRLSDSPRCMLRRIYWQVRS